MKLIDQLHQAIERGLGQTDLIITFKARRAIKISDDPALEACGQW